MLSEHPWADLWIALAGAVCDTRDMGAVGVAEAATVGSTSSIGMAIIAKTVMRKGNFIDWLISVSAWVLLDIECTFQERSAICLFGFVKGHIY